MKRQVTFADPLITAVYVIPGNVENRSHILSDKERQCIMKKLRYEANKVKNKNTKSKDV